MSDDVVCPGRAAARLMGNAGILTVVEARRGRTDRHGGSGRCAAQPVGLCPDPLLVGVVVGLAVSGALGPPASGRCAGQFLVSENLGRGHRMHRLAWSYLGRLVAPRPRLRGQQQVRGTPNLRDGVINQPCDPRYAVR